jgi:hypothetical protein
LGPISGSGVRWFGGARKGLILGSGVVRIGNGARRVLLTWMKNWEVSFEVVDLNIENMEKLERENQYVVSDKKRWKDAL